MVAIEPTIGPWLQHADMRWSAEASELRWSLAGNGPYICPNCDQPISPGEQLAAIYTPRLGWQTNITHWTLNHTCGATLTIWND